MSVAGEIGTTFETSTENSASAYTGLAGRDPLYLFACHLAWRHERDLRAYQELVAALDDCDPSIRALAETLLHRASPRPGPQARLAAGHS
jgi:hypothetical protein